MLRWYAITVHAGQEFRVKAELDRRVSAIRSHSIADVVVPTERSSETRSGQVLSAEARVMPGYVLINARLTETAWALIRGTQGVAGIVGSANEPVPLSQVEVDRLLGRGVELGPLRTPFEVGAPVEVISGPFVGLAGEVVEINEDAARLKVTIPMFGRDTLAEVGFDQVKAK